MKKCSKCNESYPDYADMCPKCGIDLDTGEKIDGLGEIAEEKPRPKFTEENELKKVGTYLNQADASTALSFLEAHGIKGVLFFDDCGGMRPHVSYLTGIRLMVERKDAAKASELLEGK